MADLFMVVRIHAAEFMYASGKLHDLFHAAVERQIQNSFGINYKILGRHGKIPPVHGPFPAFDPNHDGYHPKRKHLCAEEGYPYGICPHNWRQTKSDRQYKDQPMSDTDEIRHEQVFGTLIEIYQHNTDQREGQTQAEKAQRPSRQCQSFGVVLDIDAYDRLRKNDDQYGADRTEHQTRSHGYPQGLFQHFVVPLSKKYPGQHGGSHAHAHGYGAKNLVHIVLGRQCGYRHRTAQNQKQPVESNAANRDAGPVQRTGDTHRDHLSKLFSAFYRVRIFNKIAFSQRMGAACQHCRQIADRRGKPHAKHPQL